MALPQSENTASASGVEQLVVTPNDGYQVLIDSEASTSTPTPKTYVLSNPGDATLDYQVSTNAPWIEINRTQGQLEAGSETSIIVSANADVITLAPNQLHQAEVRFDNLSDANSSTRRIATAFVLPGSGSGWGISTTEGFDDNSSLAAVDLPPNTTAELRFLVNIPMPPQASIAAASIPDLNLSLQQRRRGMEPEDNVTVLINGEQVRQWFGNSDWRHAAVSLESCPQFPCEVTFEFQQRQGTNGAVFLDNLALAPDVRPLAAVLPGSRSAQVGHAVTAFATLINGGLALGEDCALRPVTAVPGEFIYQTTDSATNQLEGTANVPRDIPAQGSQSFVFAFTPDAALEPTDVELRFDCSNSGPADVVTGLNTFLLSASEQPVPDVVALAATIGSNGIVEIPGENGTGVFSVASVNVGVGGTIRVSADSGSVSLPVNLLICETNNQSGACLADPASEVTTEIAADATPTFGIFVQGSGEVYFDPATNRVFVRFRDASNIVRGATSVAVRSQ